MKRTLTREDIQDNQAFLVNRSILLKEMMSIKADRRIPLGPDAMLYFENHATLCWQIQEMLRIEKGGDAQLDDELTAYAPLLPKQFDDGACELVGTFMIEIPDLERRTQVLNALGGIENGISLIINDEKCLGIPEDDVERTSETGKTSAVHFLRFFISKMQIKAFKTPGSIVKLRAEHPLYTYEIIVLDSQKTALAFDLD